MDRRWTCTVAVTYHSVMIESYQNKTSKWFVKIICSFFLWIMFLISFFTPFCLTFVSDINLELSCLTSVLVTGRYDRGTSVKGNNYSNHCIIGKSKLIWTSVPEWTSSLAPQSQKNWITLFMYDNIMSLALMMDGGRSTPGQFGPVLGQFDPVLGQFGPVLQM